MKTRITISALVILLALSSASLVWSAEIPGFDRQVLIVSREQSVQRFVTELFGRVEIPVDVAPEITGTVNGDFKGTAASIFDQVARTFQVALYFDGSKAYVYPANQSERKILRVSPAVAKRVTANAQQLGLPDSKNKVSSTDMGLVVTGSERFLEQVDQIIKAVDEPAPEVPLETEEPGDAFRMFKLRYAWAHDVVMEVGGEQITVPGVASTLRTLIEPGAVASSGVQRVDSGNTLEGLRGQGLKHVSPSTSIDNEINESVFSAENAAGSSRIVADSLNNAVLIRDKPERLAAYEQLIKTLDLEPKMVEIEATIIDMDTDRLRDLGINWRAQFEDVDALVGNGTSSDLLLQPNVSGITPLGQGGILSLVLGNKDRFISRIRALETQGAARIVSKPHVMTLSNVEALLDTTSTFFVRVEGQEEVDLFNVSVGTKLRVTPHVFDVSGRKQIKLLVSIEDGSTSDRLVDNIPIIDTSSINTQALVNVGESLLIGGLVREFKTDRLTKVPLLGDIPLIGALFRSNEKKSSRVERMFLISPRLNTRPGAGNVAKLTAPYLSGTEGEILSSAPRRLVEAQEALAARDEAFGVVESLPAAGINHTTLTPADTPARVERLQPTPPADDGKVSSPLVDGWQTVERPAEVEAATHRLAAQLPGRTDMTAGARQAVSSSFDEWQVISQ